MIEPKAGLRLKVYCDMKRDGGGWTLIVSSHHNSWTVDNVKLRHEDTPDLKKDYSILQYADHLKRNYLIKDSKFQYRLEANTLGMCRIICMYITTLDVAYIQSNKAMSAVNSEILFSCSNILSPCNLLNLKVSL